jgi:hypothetical protein
MSNPRKPTEHNCGKQPGLCESTCSPSEPTEQDIERAKTLKAKMEANRVSYLDDDDLHIAAAEFAAVRKEAIDEKPSDDAWTGERREVVISTRSGMNYHFLLPIPAADALVEAESRGYLAGLEAGYRQTEGTCNCGANICAAIERVKVLPVMAPPADPPELRPPPKGSPPLRP